MSDKISQPPKVFISYSWDSDKLKNDVRNLSNRLRIHGIDCNIDQYEVSPPEGWPHWMRNQVEQSDFVLVVCTEQYKRRFQGKEELGKGKGVSWEGAIINQLIYDQVTRTKFIPVIFSSQNNSYIPVELSRFTYYSINSPDFTDKGYEALYRHITNQPKTIKIDIGNIVPLDPLESQYPISSPNADEEAQRKQLNKLYKDAHRWNKAGEWQRVIAIFQQMQELNLPYFDPDGLYRLARNQIEKEEKKAREIKNLYSQGARYLQAKDWNKARISFELILKRKPKDVYLIAQAQEKLAQIQETLEKKKRLYIGLITIIWFCSGLMSNFLGSEAVIGIGAIGGFLSGGIFGLISQETKQAKPSEQTLKLVGFIFTGCAFGFILGLWIESLEIFHGIKTWLMVILGLTSSIIVMRWQIALYKTIK